MTPSLEATELMAAPYRGNGFAVVVKFNRRCDQGYGESPGPRGIVAPPRGLCSSESDLSRSVLGSGLAVVAGFWREFSELLTLLPGVGVCVVGPPRAFSGSLPESPLAVGIKEPCPCDEDISRVAAGSAVFWCFFDFPNKNDMAGSRRG